MEKEKRENAEYQHFPLFIWKYFLSGANSEMFF